MAINRIEVIEHRTGERYAKGRAFVLYLQPDERVSMELQDNGQTLKIFLEDCDG